MVLESAILQVKAGETDEFEHAFREASEIISQMKGYITHELHHHLEVRGMYLLSVRWETLTDHTIGFRGSKAYLEWKRLLHHFYDPFPTVEYFVKVE